MQRDSKTVLALRGIAISWIIAFGKNFDLIEKLVRTMFGEIYRKGETDSTFAAYKKATVILTNVLTENRVEQCLKEPENPLQREIYSIMDTMIQRMKDEGCYEKMDIFWYNSILSQTRILPLPDRNSSIEKLVKYLEGLSRPYTVKDNLQERQRWIPRNQWTAGHQESDIVWERDLLLGCEEVGKMIGQDICINMQIEADRSQIKFSEVASRKKDYHCSLSSSSSIENGRSEGGKWNAYTDGDFRKFLENPISENFKLKEGRYHDHHGKPVANDEFGQLETWKIAYLDSPLGGLFGEVITPGYLPEGTQAFALGADTRLGTLLFEWANAEYEKFMSTYNLNLPSTYPKGKVSIVKEPGLKIRPVTCGSTWLNVFLSPAAHTLRGFLEALPACRVGLSESNGLYRFSQEYSGEMSLTDLISTSDMDSATDRAAHETGFGLLNGMINELSSQRAIGLGERDYLKKAAALLTTPKRLSVTVKGREKKAVSKSMVEGKLDGILDGNTFWFSNYRGIMMGDPLTKIVLTMSSYGAWKASVKSPSNDVRDFRLARSPSSVRHFSKVKAYACAGDDHLGIGPEEDLKRIPKIMESMSYSISWDKYNINDTYVSYCQLYGMLPHKSAVSKAKALKEGKPSKFIQIDTPKVRLLTQFQKMGGKENFDKPDPLVGKSLQMFKDIQYARETIGLSLFKEDEGMARFCCRLQSFINMQACYVRALMPSWMEWKVITNPLTFLPPELGGLGIHLPHDVSIRSDPKAKDLAARFVTKIENPRFNDVALEWERGVLVSNVIINRLIKTGDAEILDEDGVKESAREEIISNSASGPNISISNMKLWNTINSKYMCLDREIPLVSSKENAYVQLAVEPGTKLQVVRKLRARQLLTIRRNELNKFDPKDNFDWSDPIRTKFYVKTESVRTALQTMFVMPCLKIDREIFSTNPRKYPKWFENVESVRDSSVIGSFDASIDESHISEGAESSS